MKRNRPPLLPLVVLLVGLLATIAAASLLARAEADRHQARFDQLASGAVQAIEARMLAQLTLLRGAAGLFNASDEVEREDFRAYVARLRLERNYPGVLGIGYSVYARDADAMQAVVTAARGSGLPGFTHRPPGPRQDYSAILYIEPMNRLNAAALGFDMLSEGTRRAAMEAAVRSGAAHMSGRVRLVQEIDVVKQPGFLIYLPLYRGGDVANSRNLYGWVYSPLRAHDLFSAIFTRQDISGVTVEVYDGQVAPGSLLFQSAEPQAQPRLATIRPLEIAGRPWLVRITSAPSFDERSPIILALIVSAAGTAISLLLAWVVWQQAGAKLETERRVQQRTAELSEANARLLEEAQARQEAEAKVAQMQKMEAIGQLTGGIAHDFNNMLTVVLGNLDIARRRLDQPERLARAVDHAREGAQKAADLTQRLLAFGRQQALVPKVIDPNKLIAGMSELLRRALGETVQLETVLAGGVWPVCADVTQIESAILNIAINARDAMPEGGRLTIETANTHLDEHYVRHHVDLKAGQYVLIAISDTGTGMPQDVVTKALEPFFTTKEVGRGTGLGLSQVYGFVKQSGGHLSLYSELGEGTTVKIYMPRHRGEATAEDEDDLDAQELPRARAGEVVLVVEDEDQVRALSAETLRELGYEVLTASRGTEALELLDQRPDVRLLFTDVVMPEMNGRVLADRARAARPDLRVVFTTGYTRNAIVHHGRLDEGVALLNKPFTAGDLARRIRQELDRDEPLAKPARA